MGLFQGSVAWITFSLVLLGGSGRLARADAIGVETLPLTVHVADETIQLGERYKRSLTSDGRVVITPGLEIYYDRDLDTDFLRLDTLRFTIGAYYDSIDHKSGYVAILPRWEFPINKRWQISFGLGPALIFRETWTTVPGYEDDGFYNRSDRFLPGYQYKVLIGGDLDFQYRLTPRLQAVWSIVPAIPYVIVQTFGLRWTF